MKIYADSSFIVKLLTDENDSEEARAEYRRVGVPKLPLLTLHILEFESSIRQHAFHSRRSIPSGERGPIARERDTALARFDQWRRRKWLVETFADWDEAMNCALRLTRQHTERLGCRAYDVMHVAFAFQMNYEAFLTTDRIQVQLARAAGLTVHSIGA